MAEDNTPTNVVDDLAKQNELINNFVNSMKTEGNLEFYVKHSGTEVPASSIRYNPRIGIGSQIPGFYTEPLGIRDIKAMGGRGGPNAISNYYKVQVNSNNLLISAGGGKVTGLKSPISSVGYADLGNEIEKIDWKIFEQETGLSWENDFNGKRLFSVENGQKYLGSDSQGFIKRLGVMGLTDDEISSALRKSGIEGFVSGPTNNQYEVVLLDPNDDLGVGKNINVQDATETDFVNNQSKVNQIDELIIDTPTNVVDVGNVHDNPNYKVSLNVDNNGNVIIYRSTNTPDRFSDTDFSKFEINKTIGEQTYFASNPEFAQSFSQSGKRNIYSFSTNIKPEEILHLQSNIYENKELLNKLGGQEYINNIVNERGINNYRFNSLDNIPKSLTWSELYYSTNKGRTDGSKEILQREIVELQNNGVKAIGVSPVSGAKNEYNILPIINEQSQLDIVAKGLIDKNLIEVPTDTPTNVELVKDTYVINTDTPKNVVGDEFVDNYGKTTTGFIDDLPLEKPVKDVFLNAADSRLKRLGAQLAKPSGILDTVDIWEVGVLALVAGAIAYNEIDEIPKITKNTILRTYNLSQGRPIDAPLRIIGLPVLKVSEYDIDFEYAMETLEKGEKVMPTEIAIDYVQEKAEEFEGESTASGYAYMTPSAKNTDTMETTQKIQPGVQEEKMFEQLRPKKTKSAGGSGARIQ